MPFYMLIDSFDEALGSSAKSLEEARDRIEEMGEAAGEMRVIEVEKFVAENANLKDVSVKPTGRSWSYDFLKEQLVEI